MRMKIRRICVGLLPEMIKARRRITVGRLWEAIIVLVSLGLLLAFGGCLPRVTKSYSNLSGDGSQRQGYLTCWFIRR